MQTIGIIMIGITLLSCSSVATYALYKDNDSDVLSKVGLAEQDEAKAPDKDIIEWCSEGNCPCGDGFCSEDSYCIKDTCVCGAFPEKGYVHYDAVASNQYGEFKCVSYGYKEGCGSTQTFDFVCEYSEGCKTGDGREFEKTEDIYEVLKNNAEDEGYVIYDEDKSVYDYYEEHEKLHIALSSERGSIYDDIVREQYLIDNHCDKALPENLKILDRADGGQYEEGTSPADPECDLRKACMDAGVTTEHVSEYVCDIGKQYYNECGWGYRQMPIGLRCDDPKGCTCGDNQCPRHAICKNGSCKYDMYFEHHVCPDKQWNKSKSDIDNYIKISKGNEACDCTEENDYNDLGNEKECYDKCYWDNYDSTVKSVNPCGKTDQ